MNEVKPTTVQGLPPSIKAAEEACDAAWAEYQRLVVAEREARDRCAGARENFRRKVEKLQALQGKLPPHLV